MRALRLRYLAPLGLWLASAALISLAEGTPDPPPAVALGSTTLLHALRAAALFAIGLGAATVLAHAGAGRLPTQLLTSGVVFEARESLESEAALAELQEQVERQRASLNRAAERLDALEQKL
jgi:hypothetical protein